MPENTNTNQIPTNEPTTSLDAMASNVFSVNTETPISRINAEETAKTQAEDISIDKFIVPEEQKDKEQVVLGDSGTEMNLAHKVRVLNYWKMFVISLIIAVVAGIASLILWMYNRYLSAASQAIVDPTQQGYVQNYQAVQQTVQRTLGISQYEKYTSLGLAWTDAQSNVATILQAPGLNYINKKTLMQKAIDQFSPIFIANKNRLENVKQEITKYGFFPQELFNLLQNDENITSIKDSLLALEMIKFSSAIKVFSYLDTFVSTVGTLLNLPVEKVQAQLDILTQRGEKDIAVYLNNCYLNPYEVDYDCNLVWDFDRYYNIVDKWQSIFDRWFFKKTMAFIDAKLEQTELPSFAITFQNFDPTKKQISFKVEVNTFQQDEAALTKKWIINPHIFIVSNLLNLIKQSLFVISENIDAKQLKIVPKTIKIGSTVFNVNNSTMTFGLPVQETTQREITDYSQKALLNTTQ